MNILGYLYLPTNLFTLLCTCLSICLCIYLPTNIHLIMYLPLNLYVYLSVHLPMYKTNNLLTYLSYLFLLITHACSVCSFSKGYGIKNLVYSGKYLHKIYKYLQIPTHTYTYLHKIYKYLHKMYWHSCTLFF